MLRQRIITAAVGIPAMLVLLYLGDIWWALGIALLTGAGAREVMAMFARKAKGAGPSDLLVMCGGIFSVLAAYAFSERALLYWVPFLIAVVCAAFARELWQSERAPAVNVGSTLLAVFYPGILFAHLILLRQLPDGFIVTLFVLACTWASDSAAYFVGLSVGRHKLLPAVSPKKTWEGAVGGLAGGTVIGILLARFIGVTVGIGALLGLLISAAGQLGDLAASSLKREAGIKDTGKLLPGHGGIIDRFDSLLFAGPVVYYTLLLVRGWPLG